MYSSVGWRLLFKHIPAHDSLLCIFNSSTPILFHPLLAYFGSDSWHDVGCDSGVVLPLGSSVSRKEKPTEKHQRYCWMAHHEYVVYREEQVALRYLIQFQS